MPKAQPKADRRLLRFDHLDAATADAERLATADAAGTLTTSGQWSLGQSLNHLAAWVEYSYDGVPMKVPLPIRLVLRLTKRRTLYKPMKPGMRLPKVPGGTLAMELASTADGLDRFRRSFTKIGSAPPGRPHLLFGPMTRDEWHAQHLRHCELHLSFFRLEGAPQP